MTLTTFSTLSVQIKYLVLLIIFPSWILIFTSCGNQHDPSRNGSEYCQRIPFQTEGQKKNLVKHS